MKPTLPKNYLLYTAIGIFLLFVVMLILFFNSPSGNEPTGNLPTPTSISVPTVRPRANAPLLGELPKQNEAINTNSPVVRTSEQEIAIVYANLPYSKEFTSATGEEISIVIPTRGSQAYPWVLTVNIFGPEYQIEKSDPLYEKEKAMFIEGANDVFAWIRSTGADPDNILIMWSEKASLQERAEEWLRTQ